MKISVSNLAFPTELKEEAYRRMRALGVEGVEIAPTRIANWDELTTRSCLEELTLLRKFGLQASSLQAVLFGKPHLQLLQDERTFSELLAHMKRVGEIAEAFEVSVVVFGAPKNRRRGEKTEAEASSLGESRLKLIGAELEQHGAKLCIEPVPDYYGGDFLTSAASVIDIVRRIDHPSVRLHLDTGCVMLGGGDISIAIASGIDILAHFHAAEPNLSGFEAPTSPHEAAAAALGAAGYERWVAIEMLEASSDKIERLEGAVRYVTAIYN